ncbi:MAG: hypothetical protein ACRCWG_10505 [Sarcina sp.]
MKIKDILKQQQPEVYNRLKKLKVKTVNEDLTKSDFENMMKHSSYRRGRGGIRQVR